MSPSGTGYTLSASISSRASASGLGGPAPTQHGPRVQQWLDAHASPAPPVVLAPGVEGNPCRRPGRPRRSPLPCSPTATSRLRSPTRTRYPSAVAAAVLPEADGRLVNPWQESPWLPATRRLRQARALAARSALAPAPPNNGTQHRVHAPTVRQRRRAAQRLHSCLRPGRSPARRAGRTAAHAVEHGDDRWLAQPHPAVSGQDLRGLPVRIAQHAQQDVFGTADVVVPEPQRLPAP